MIDKKPIYDMALTKGVCEVLAQTDWPGLTGSEIEGLLLMVRVPELEMGSSKRDRIYRTLHNTQVRQGCGNVLPAFIARAMAPGRYAEDPQRWQELRAGLDAFLVHYGYRIGDDGRMTRGAKAANLDEAAELAGSLRHELQRRGVHSELLRYCSRELVSRSLFHAVSEAAKSIPARIRLLTGFELDGEKLYQEVFGTKSQEPALYFNAYRTESEISAHKGFKNLLLGIHGHYRNPRAHATRLDSDEDKQEFYDAFAFFSHVHRQLDKATRQKPAGD